MPLGPEGLAGLRDRPFRAAGTRAAIARAGRPSVGRNAGEQGRLSEQETEFLKAGLGLVGALPDYALDAHEFRSPHVLAPIVNERNVFNGRVQAVQDVPVDAARGLADTVVQENAKKSKRLPHSDRRIALAIGYGALDRMPTRTPWWRSKRTSASERSFASAMREESSSTSAFKSSCDGSG